MQRTAQLNWLGTLAAVAVLTSGLAQAATITINPGKVAWGSSGTGTARIGYATYTDAYYLNNNTSTGTPWINGYQNGVDSQTNAAWCNEGNGTWYLCGTTGSGPTILTWKFDTSGMLIQAMTIKDQTSVFKDGVSDTSATWAWSVNGTDYYNYVSLSSNAGNTADDSTHDLTSYLNGHSSFYIQATLNHFSSAITPQIFRSGAWSDYYDLDVNMTVMAIPEPASLGLLALGGLFVLRRRRN